MAGYDWTTVTGCGDMAGYEWTTGDIGVTDGLDWITEAMGDGAARLCEITVGAAKVCFPRKNWIASSMVANFSSVRFVKPLGHFTIIGRSPFSRTRVSSSIALAIVRPPLHLNGSR
jgi:hypothetical protein